MAYQAPEQNYAQGLNVHQQEWTDSLCNCAPVSSCCLSFWVPCILYAKTSERMNDPSLSQYTTCNSDCAVFCLINCAGVGWVLNMLKRKEIRERYGIKGSTTTDCCSSYWCLCCALIQQDKEVQKRVAGGPITQGYQAQKEGMHMPNQGSAPAPVPFPENGPPPGAYADHGPPAAYHPHNPHA